MRPNPILQWSYGDKEGTFLVAPEGRSRGLEYRISSTKGDISLGGPFVLTYGSNNPRHTRGVGGKFDSLTDAKDYAEKMYSGEVKPRGFKENALSNPRGHGDMTPVEFRGAIENGLISLYRVSPEEAKAAVREPEIGWKIAFLYKQNYSVDAAIKHIHRMLNQSMAPAYRHNPDPPEEHLSPPAKAALWIGSIATIVGGGALLISYFWPVPSETLNYKGVVFNVEKSGGTWTGTFSYGSQTYSTNGSSRDDAIARVHAQVDALVEPTSTSAQAASGG